MNLSRRGILGMLAAGVGAAIVRPGLIMPIKPALVRAPYDPTAYARYLADQVTRLRDSGTVTFPVNPMQDDSVTVNGTVYRFNIVKIGDRPGPDFVLMPPGGRVSPSDAARLDDAFERGRMTTTWGPMEHTGERV